MGLIGGVLIDSRPYSDLPNKRVFLINEQVNKYSNLSNNRVKPVNPVGDRYFRN